MNSIATHFHQLLPWMNQYGSIVIFVLLALGIIALPIPEESLLLFLGFLMAKGKIPIVSSVLMAYAGTCCGITGSYGLGRLTGHYLHKSWGRYIGLTEKRYQAAHRWFEKVGKFSLSIGYFIPGVRHLTGYVAGALKLEYRLFALYAYSGGIVWASVFMTLGYFFATHWNTTLQKISHYISF